MAVGLVLLALIVYYLYKYLQGDATKEDMVVYNMTGNGLIGTRETIFDVANIPTLYAGGEYSVSMWVYVNNWSVSNSGNKMLLRISSGSSTNEYSTLVLYMGKQVNKLGARVSFETGTAIDATQLTLIRNSTSPYSDMASDFQKCDIETIDLQRWVNVTVVLSGRTVDIYVDGKLSRSCVNAGLFRVADPLTAKMVVGSTTNGVGGYIGSIRAANFAYTPDTVYQIYQKGPKDESFLSQLASWFNPSEYSFSLKRGGQEIVSASTAATSPAGAATT